MTFGKVLVDGNCDGFCVDEASVFGMRFPDVDACLTYHIRFIEASLTSGSTPCLSVAFARHCMN
jgi:hypothetical protein